MIEILVWLVSYVIFVFLISLFINGIKISSSGETTVLPDGSEKDSEMILYPLAKFLNQKKSFPVYLTSYRVAEKLMKKVNSAGFGILMVAIRSQRDENTCETIMVSSGMLHKLIEVMSFIDPGYVIKETELANSIAIYKEIEVYRFSKYIRKPIIQCIICMASFWGSIAYWIPVYMFVGISSATIVVWIFTCFILSYVNYLIYKHK